jgi:acetyl esterase/lipase
MIMVILAYILSGLSLLMGIVLIMPQPKFPLNFWSLIPKLGAGALSAFWTVMGAAGAVFGAVSGAYWAIPIGMIGAGILGWYVWQCSRDHKGFEEAFGAGWEEQISIKQAKNMTKKRWAWFLNMKTSPEPIWECDVPFWTIPGTNRELLCDIWRPADGRSSGMAVIYIHGGAWFIWDKDYYTKPFFRHLAAQGHTIMDVSYRLCPEVDFFGMIGDVKHAIAWMKANASAYDVNPEKIVIAGASAGGHLSQIAGYTPGHPDLTPEELKDTDQSVCGVISYYGFTDLMAMWRHMSMGKIEDPPPVPVGENLGPNRGMKYLGRMDIFLGGWPDDVPEIYQLASPVSHVHLDNPPTLLLQGEQDIFCPVDASRAHFEKLVESGVPAINVVFPYTNHAFDLLLPQISPAAQSALYDVDRFLALLVNNV